MCGRDVAISLQGRTWRHDPASGRTPELRSCPGSLKPVRPPGGDDLVLFLNPGDTTAAADDIEAPAPPALF